MSTLKLVVLLGFIMLTCVREVWTNHVGDKHSSLSKFDGTRINRLLVGQLFHQRTLDNTTLGKPFHQVAPLQRHGSLPVRSLPRVQSSMRSWLRGGDLAKSGIGVPGRVGGRRHDRIFDSSSHSRYVGPGNANQYHGDDDVDDQDPIDQVWPTKSALGEESFRDIQSRAGGHTNDRGYDSGLRNFNDRVDNLDAIDRIWTTNDSFVLLHNVIPPYMAAALESELEDLKAICVEDPLEHSNDTQLFRDDRICTIDADLCRHPEVQLPSTAAAIDLLYSVARRGATAPGRPATPIVTAPWVQLACFQPSADGYRAHRDLTRFKETGGGLTTILYLNRCWDRERDGGCLRIHRSGDAEQPWYDIDPEFGTLIQFRSPEVLHEVRPSRRTRLALTLWAGPGLDQEAMATAGAIVAPT
eukprot:gnl/MRDRNA2_/MRDRNA2_215721_c0_seq1.p1 gnl/MRDRNA2_/MRDRNA2_215721_c0~~gnl/MRDRNA2_/MRDRNA2_215721_c0_seq1.p1  ORF type:complete len:436 (-),score=51.06 gnl/MRDRNA2_/MRDRNA2_215721_c0_seq1:71-1309(-)